MVGAQRGGARRRDRRTPTGLPGRFAGQLVPRPGHRAGQRGSHRRRPQRAGQLPGFPETIAAVDDAHHRLLRSAPRRPRCPGLAGEGQDHAAQLDRALHRSFGAVRCGRRGHRGVHHPAGHPVRGHLPGARSGTRFGGRPGCTPLAGGGRSAVDRRCGQPPRSGGSLPALDRREVRSGTPGEQDQDRGVHRQLCHQSGQRAADSDLHRRLRPTRLRDRGHHGGARPRSA